MWVCHNIPEITMVYITYVCVCTGECQWGDLPLIKKMMTACHSLFPVVRYSFTTIPSYCGGQVGFVLASLNKVRCVCVCVHVVINTSLLFSYTPLHITCSPLPIFPTPILLFIFSGHCVWRAHPKVIRGGARGDGTTVLWQWCTQGSLHATTLRKEGRYIHTHSS